MHTVRSYNQRILGYFRQHRVASIVAGHGIVVAVLAMVLLGSTFGSTLFGAFAQSPCSGGDQVYMVSSGDTLGAIASRYHTTWQHLASYNRINNPNMIYVAQHICVPGAASVGLASPGYNSGVGALAAIRGMFNPYPYGQCTRWADQRFYQMHGFYVPWTTNANAWAWTARAYEYHWHVSSSPSVGAIIDLQPWTQGAYGLGHVAVVERVLGNGHVIASNVNWGAFPWQVTYVDFYQGPGVTFITP